MDRITEYGDIHLELSEEEAKSLYKVTCPITPLYRFYDIWENLGEDVPLLEYLYSINHETTLRSMLESPYNGLSTLQKKIVAYIVITNYLGSTVSEDALYELDEFDSIELSSNLNDLIDEYFVNINGNFECLHPVRTEILKKCRTVKTNNNVSNPVPMSAKRSLLRICRMQPGLPISELDEAEHPSPVSTA